MHGDIGCAFCLKDWKLHIQTTQFCPKSIHSFSRFIQALYLFQNQRVEKGLLLIHLASIRQLQSFQCHQIDTKVHVRTNYQYANMYVMEVSIQYVYFQMHTLHTYYGSQLRVKGTVNWNSMSSMVSIYGIQPISLGIQLLWSQRWLYGCGRYIRSQA